MSIGRKQDAEHQAALAAGSLSFPRHPARPCHFPKRCQWVPSVAGENHSGCVLLPRPWKHKR